MMPIGFYGILTPSDADAIVAYVQSLKPVKNKVADPIYKMRKYRTRLPRHREAGQRRPMMGTR